MPNAEKSGLYFEFKVEADGGAVSAVGLLKPDLIAYSVSPDTYAFHFLERESKESNKWRESTRYKGPELLFNYDE